MERPTRPSTSPTFKPSPALRSLAASPGAVRALGMPKSSASRAIVRREAAGSALIERSTGERLLGGLPDGQRALRGDLSIDVHDAGFDLYAAYTDGQGACVLAADDDPRSGHE